ALIPQPLLPKKEKGSRIQSPSPSLGEGFRVRACVTGMHPLDIQGFQKNEVILSFYQFETAQTYILKVF
ncbi:MAG: hypothetical protein AAGG51_27150, partial [Cyanobacteria bacterium P01_G01_bin.54]